MASVLWLLKASGSSSSEGSDNANTFVASEKHFDFRFDFFALHESDEIFLICSSV